MKVIFMAFTPYHIRLSNLIANEYYKNQDKKIIISSFSGLSFEKLNKFINYEIFKNVKYFNLNYNIKLLFQEYSYILKKYKEELKGFIDEFDLIDGDIIVYFSDQPIPYQIIMNKYKNKCKLIMVEEGIGTYNKVKKISLKNKIHFEIRKFIFSYKQAKLYPLGKGGYENEIIALEPQLINKEEISINRIKINKDLYLKYIASDKKNHIDIKEKSTLLSPLCMSFVYKENIIYKIMEDIFVVYEDVFRKHLYIKLHPADKSDRCIKKILCTRKWEFIHLIEDDSLTSEDLVLNLNIDEVISDFSSTLINSYYLKSTINLTSYYNLIKDKYNCDLNVDNELFNYMISKKIIKFIDMSNLA